jgi:WD40 repeat protein
LAISRDGRWLATGSSDTTARVWDLSAKDPAAAPTILRTYEQKSDAANDSLTSVISKTLSGIQALELSPDGRWLVTGSVKAQLWDRNAKDAAAKPVDLAVDDGSGGALGQMVRGISGIVAIVISPDGHWLAVGSGDNSARLFDLNKKNPAAAPIVLRGHQQGIRALSISADSRWLATGSWDGTARLWDLTAENPAAGAIVLRGYEQGIRALSISADNRWLATQSEDNTIRLWHLQLPELIALARVRAGRNLSRAEWDQYFTGQPYRKTFPDLPGAEEP